MPLKREKKEGEKKKNGVTYTTIRQIALKLAQKKKDNISVKLLN